MEDCLVKELNEMEANKLSGIEFKRMVIRMLKELSDNYKELSGNYKSKKNEIETINKNQEEINNIVSKNTNKTNKQTKILRGMTIRLDEEEH